MFSAEHSPEFQLGDRFLALLNLFQELLGFFFIPLFFNELKEDLHLLGLFPILFPARDTFQKGGSLFHDLLRGLSLFPEIRSRHQLSDLIQPFFFAFDVKEDLVNFRGDSLDPSSGLSIQVT
jgi:hypothetical protein